MAHVRKSMEFVAFSAVGAWGAHRTLAWLHEPPVRDRVEMVRMSPRGSGAPFR